MTTIYKSVMSEDGKTVFYGEPHSMSRFGQNNSVVLDCLSGSRTGPFKTGIMIPCVDGKQTWPGYYFPGLLTDTSKVIFDKSIQGKWRVPANLHVGCMGLAPSEVDFADSVPPMPYGGNVDDRRIGVGATMYYPIAVKGALLSMGDGHFAQGDGELELAVTCVSVCERVCECLCICVCLCLLLCDFECALRVMKIVASLFWICGFVSVCVCLCACVNLRTRIYVYTGELDGTAIEMSITGRVYICFLSLPLFSHLCILHTLIRLCVSCSLSVC